MHIFLILHKHIVLLHKLLLRGRQLLICSLQLLVAVAQLELGLLALADVNQGTQEQDNFVLGVHNRLAAHFKPDIMIVLRAHPVF
ncbi:hypothetical protein D3C81_1579440 [compost metagenome]